MFSFKLNVSHHYIYAVMSAMYIGYSLGLQGEYVSVAFSITYALLALEKVQD